MTTEEELVQIKAAVVALATASSKMAATLDFHNMMGNPGSKALLSSAASRLTKIGNDIAARL